MMHAVARLDTEHQARRAQLDAIARAKLWYDPNGHYARSDVFKLVWDKRRKPPVERIE